MQHVFLFMLICLTLCFIFSIDKCEEDDNLPSMESLEISKKSTVVSISNHFGGEDEEDIPDMEEYDEPDCLIETVPVS